MSYITHCHESWHIHQWVMSHTHVIHNSLPRTMTHTSVSHATHTRHTQLIATLHVAHISESCHTHEWVVYNTRQQHHLPLNAMSHDTHIRESCHTHEWVIYNTQQHSRLPLHSTSHDAHISESCHTYKYTMLSHISTTSSTSSPHEPCHTHQWVTSHTWMCYVWHTATISRASSLHESWRTHQWVICHTYEYTMLSHTSTTSSAVSPHEPCHVTHIRESCHTHEWVNSHISDSPTYKSVMSHPMPLYSFTRETYIHGGEGVVTHPHQFPARRQIAQTAKRRVSTLHPHIQMSHVTNMNKSCPQPYHITTNRGGLGSNVTHPHLSPPQLPTA